MKEEWSINGIRTKWNLHILQQSASTCQVVTERQGRVIAFIPYVSGYLHGHCEKWDSGLDHWHTWERVKESKCPRVPLGEGLHQYHHPCCCPFWFLLFNFLQSLRRPLESLKTSRFCWGNFRPSDMTSRGGREVCKQTNLEIGLFCSEKKSDQGGYITEVYKTMHGVESFSFFFPNHRTWGQFMGCGF